MDSIFKYDIIGNPRTLDPQTVRDSSGLELIANIYDGLLRLDDKGNVECAVAESYSVSDDGLRYTFKLRDDVFWYDGDEYETQCTANDFVFAFQRLFKPTTKSQSASDFYSIRNSQGINKGVLTDMSQLGVKATNDFELEITLEYPNPMLPFLLTTAAAMPCNEDFYNKCDGKYGLYDTTVASNGSFFVYSWIYDQWSKDSNYIILRRNTKNNTNKDICPYGLNFFIDEADSYKNFTDGTTHAYISSGAEALTLLDSGFNYTESDNSVWGIMFNMKSVFKNEALRKALAYSIDRDKLLLDTTGYNKASGIVPDGIDVGGQDYRTNSGKCILNYSSILSQNKIKELYETVQRNETAGLTLIAPKDDTLLNYVSAVTQQWQSDIGFFCNISTYAKDEYEQKIKNGDFDFALVCLSGDYNNPAAYLSYFTGNSSKNYSGFSDNVFDETVSEAERSANDELSVESFKKAEELIIDSAAFIPICYQSEYVFFANNCEDINYNPFSKTVEFKNAKNFG